jgi:glutathione S-transferase
MPAPPTRFTLYSGAVTSIAAATAYCVEMEKLLTAGTWLAGAYSFADIAFYMAAQRCCSKIGLRGGWNCPREGATDEVREADRI